MEGLASALQRSTLDDPSADPAAEGAGAASPPPPPPPTTTTASGAAAAAAASGSDGSRELASIHDLPDELLSRCLVEAGRQGGRPAAVSGRFRRLYLTTPALWREITIEPGLQVLRLGPYGLSVWRDAKSALLRRTAGMARSVRLRSAGPAPGEPPAMWQLIGAAMGSLLPCLPSPALEKLDIQVWQLVVNPPTLGGALASLPALKHLSVGPPSDNQEAGLTFLEGPLPAMAQLENLTLDCLGLPHGVVAALPSLSQLTALIIGTVQPLPNELAESVMQLPKIHRLELIEASSTEEGMVLPDPAFLIHPITLLRLAARRIQLSAIPGRTDVLKSYPHGGEQEPMVGLEMIKHSVPLLSLLWATGAETGHLDRLDLTDCHLSAAAVPAPLPPSIPAEIRETAFQRLGTIVLQGCSPVQGQSLAGFLSALLPQLPALSQMILNACDLSSAAEAEGLGAAFGLAPHLTYLSTNECSLEQVPAGAYLAGLEFLSVCGNSLTSVPPALASASRLSELDLSGNPALELGSQAETMLASLPALRDLGLWLTPADSEALGRLQQSAPHLRIRTTNPLEDDNA